MLSKVVAAGTEYGMVGVSRRHGSGMWSGVVSIVSIVPTRLVPMTPVAAAHYARKSTTTPSTQSVAMTYELENYLKLHPEVLKDVLGALPASEAFKLKSKATEWASTTDGAASIALKAIEGDVTPPSMKMLVGVFAAAVVPMIGFGFVDNFVMIAAGEHIDHTIGVGLGISTMAAAGLGNLVSDLAGVGTQGAIEQKLGVKLPPMSAEQHRMARTKAAEKFGQAVGITIGCLLGMVPLLFPWFDKDTTKEWEVKLGSYCRAIDAAVDEFGDAGVTKASLYIVDRDDQRVFTLDCKDNLLGTTQRVYLTDSDSEPHQKAVGAVMTSGEYAVLTASGEPFEYDPTRGDEEIIVGIPAYGPKGDVVGVVLLTATAGPWFAAEGDPVGLEGFVSVVSLSLSRWYEGQDPEVDLALAINAARNTSAHAHAHAHSHLH